MMRRLTFMALVACVTVPRSAVAQSLMRRVMSDPDGSVHFAFASRPGVCGDGATYLRDGFGGTGRIYQGGNFSGHMRDDDWPPCIPGPVHVVATISGGELLRLHTYVGAQLRAREQTGRELGLVSVNEAADFLTRVAEQAHGGASADAILPLVLADSIVPWPALFRFARDERMPRAIRGKADFWLARGAAAKLGVADRDDDDDDLRISAVFALSQQPKDVAVPQLISLARHNTHPAVRAQAVFWLGQSHDPRALDLFEEILRTR